MKTRSVRLAILALALLASLACGVYQTPAGAVFDTANATATAQATPTPVLPTVAPLPTQWQATISGSWNVREGAGLAFAVLAVITDDDVRVLATRGDWLYIVYQCGEMRCTGWVHGEAIR